MSEQDVIKHTNSPLHFNDFIHAFKTLGLTQEDTVLVHASLSKMGYVIGGAFTVVQALKAYFSKGTVMMPTQTSANSNPEAWENPPVPEAWIKDMKKHMPAYTHDMPTRGMGIIVEAFRASKEVYRSDHPTVSFAAWGADAKTLISNHSLTPAFGEKSPLATFYKRKGKILCMGTSYDTVTFLHYPETKSKFKQIVEQQTAMIVEGKRSWVHYKDIDYGMVDFNRLGQSYEKSVQVNHIIFGKTHMKVIDSQSLYTFADTYMNNKKNIEPTNTK